MKLCKSHLLAVLFMMLLYVQLLGQYQQPILDINASLVGLEAQTSQPHSYLPPPPPPTHTSLGGQIEIIEMFHNVDRYRTFHYNTELVNLNEYNIGQTIGLTFFDDSFYTADILSVTENYLGRTIITAKINDTDFARIIIIASENTITISAKLPENDEYYFASVKHGQAYLGQARLSEMEKDRVSCLACEEHHDWEAAHLSPNSELRTPNFHSDDPVIIDLLYVYTPAAAQWALSDWQVTDIDDLIDITLADTNFIHANSNTSITFNIVHRHLTNYVETDTSLDFERLTYPNDGYMDEVHVLRNTYYADLIVFLAEISYTGGTAWLLNSFSGFSIDYYAVSINRVQQASWTRTVTHEIGHNMGAHHHRDQLVQPGPNYALGNYTSGWRGSIQGALRNTVMTYGAGQYWQDGLTSTDIPYFSSPLITVNGVVIGNATLYDNARILRETKVVTAGYRTPPYLNDLNAQSITGASSIPQNSPATYTVRVLNSGQNTATGYTVRLMRVGSSTPLSTVNGTTLTVGNFSDFNLSWTPTVVGANQLYGEIVWSLDENPLNNQTPLLNVSVHAEGILFSENFNSGTSLEAIGWGGTLSQYSGIIPLSGVNNSNALALNVWQSTTTQNAYTPTISGVASDSELFFAYRIVNYTTNWGGPLTATTLGTGDVIHIEVSTTGATGTYASIRQINSSNHTSSTNFATITQSLSAYNGQNINIRFRVERGTGDWYFVLDDVFVSGSGAIVLNPPTNLQAYVSGQNVNLTWNAPSSLLGTQPSRLHSDNVGNAFSRSESVGNAFSRSESVGSAFSRSISNADRMSAFPVLPDLSRNLLGYNVYRGTTLLTPTPTTNLYFTQNNVPIGTYTYHVTAVYTQGESEPVSIEVTIQPTGPITTLLHEGFESTSGHALPVGWVKEGGTNEIGWRTISNTESLINITDLTPVYAGSRILARSWSHAGPNNWVFSTGLPLTQGVQATISFWYTAAGYAQWGEFDNFELRIGTTPTGVGMASAPIIFSNINNNVPFTQFTQAVVNFTPPTTATYYLAFHDLTPPEEGFAILIDEVKVEVPSGQTVTVSGVVISSNTNAGVPSASVTLSGANIYGHVLTSSTGAFTIPNVSTSANYLLTINASGYVAYTDSIVVSTTDLNLGNIMIFEFTYPPRNVVATINSENQSVLVQWEEPHFLPPENWFTHTPSNTVHGGLGHGDLGGLGTVEIAHRFTQAQLIPMGISGATLSRISFVATNFTTQPIINFGTIKVRAYVGGSGSPYNPGTMVHEQIVPISDVIYNIDPTAAGIPAQWTDVNLSAPVSIPTTGELWITVLFENHDGFPCGRDNIGDQVNGFGNIFSYNGGLWSVINTLGYPPITSNFMIRGQAMVGGREVIIQPISYTMEEQLGIGYFSESLDIEKDNDTEIQLLKDMSVETNSVRQLNESRGSRVLTGYNVYRSTVGNATNPSLWVTIQENIPHIIGQFNYSLVDNSWASLELDSYVYIVRSVYSNNNLSNPALSNVLIKVPPDMVYIGNMNSSMTQNTIPVNNFYQRSMTQTIYYDNEIPQSGVITHLTWRFTSTGNMTQGMLAPVQVYLAPTTQTTFPNLNSWVPYNQDTWVKVWDAPFPYQPGSTTQTYFLTIPLTDIYVHDGGNLVVTVVKNWTAYDGQNNVFQQTETPSINRSIHARSDAQIPYNPSIPETATGVLQYHPNIMLTIASLDPPNPAINPNPQNNATDIPLTHVLSWQVGAIPPHLWGGQGGAISELRIPNSEFRTPTGYKIHFGTTNPPPLVHSNWTSTTWTPSPALQYATTYYWRIIPFNSGGDAENCPIWSFTTMEAPGFAISPLNHNFGEIIVGEISTIQSFTITNTGLGPLIISSITISGTTGFNLINVGALPWTPIAAGGNRSFQVSFSPNTVGYQSANIVINDNVMNAEIRMQNAEISSPTSHESSEASSGTTIGVATSDSQLTTSPPHELASGGGRGGQFPNSELRTPNSIRATHQVLLEGTGIPPIPNPAIIPNPANNATMIPLSQVLSWETGTRSAPPMKNEWGGEGGAISEFRTPNSEFRTPTGYKIHFGTTNPPPLVESNWTTMTWTPSPALQYETTYYWQIIPFNSTGEASGCPIWSFTTVPDMPIFSINPESHNFGNVIIDQSSPPQIFTITNTGTATLTISSVTIPGSHGFTLGNVTNLPWDILSGGNRTFTVTFSPTSNGYQSANIVIEDNVMNAEIRMQNAEISPPISQATWGAQNNPNSELRTPNSPRATHQVFIEGTGIPQIPNPAINPIPANNATMIPLSQVLSWEAGAIPPHLWGGQGGGELSDFLIPNSEFRTPTGYKIHFGTTNPPALVQSNWTTTSWDPSTAGMPLLHGTTYYWQIIPFNATGDAVGCPIWTFTTIPNPPVFSINPTSYYFGSITVGQTSTPHTFTITNTGGSSLEISSITLVGINQNEFNLTTDSLPWTLEANISRQFTVSFSPQAPAGTKTANLNITHNAAGSPHTSTTLTGDCLVSEGDVVIIPTELLGNFPNPFNPITSINFNTAVEGVVSIEIFDIRGSKVRTLANRVFSAGTHQIEWEGQDDAGRELGSGIYLYRMRTESYVGVKRMVLLK